MINIANICKSLFKHNKENWSNLKKDLYYLDKNLDPNILDKIIEISKIKKIDAYKLLCQKKNELDNKKDYIIHFKNNLFKIIFCLFFNYISFFILLYFSEINILKTYFIFTYNIIGLFLIYKIIHNINLNKKYKEFINKYYRGNIFD